VSTEQQQAGSRHRVTGSGAQPSGKRPGERPGERSGERIEERLALHEEHDD
jgi:hypothetical protein